MRGKTFSVERTITRQYPRKLAKLDDLNTKLGAAALQKYPETDWDTNEFRTVQQHPISVTPTEVGMGKGKGNPKVWIARVSMTNSI